MFSIFSSRLVLLYVALTLLHSYYRHSRSSAYTIINTAIRSSANRRLNYHSSPNGQLIKHHMSLLPEQILDNLAGLAPMQSHLLLAEEEAQTGFSSLSLYFTLALYIMTLPGLYSLITRSVKVKATQKVYDLPGPINPTAKPVRQIAAEVMAYFKALNYEVAAAEDVITFKGVMGRSNSQAYFLTFCTFVGLASLGLVVSVLLPDVGAKAYAVTLVSPYAGLYYWNNAQNVNEVKVKMETSDDESIVSITAEGGKEDLERFSTRLALVERGKIYVKGLFDDSEGYPDATPALTSTTSSSSSGSSEGGPEAP